MAFARKTLHARWPGSLVRWKIALRPVLAGNVK
ncbi:hypothetical protein C8J45_102234 [Sphingomonas sp. PP-CE-3G-477]|nr:hypothetical protein C8J45_102234 [Sphingomonas sp. PP-CE-3G-477]